MRVVQVAYKAEVTGGERVLLQLLRGLVSAGHEARVLAPDTGPLLEAAREVGASAGVLGLSRSYDLLAGRRLARELRDFRADLVHGHGLLVNPLTRLAARWTGLPSVTTVHLTRGLGGPMRQYEPGFRWKARLYYRPLDNLTARLADAVVAVSDAVRDDLVEQGLSPDLVRVIKNGIDPERFPTLSPEERRERRLELGASEEHFLVGVVARLSPQKGLDTFVEAFRRARERAPGLRAWVAGTGPLEAEVRARVRDAGLEESLRLLGHVEDVPARLAASDALCLSSRWEGLPLSVLEAMACRLPVVATSVPGTREALVDGETGRLVPVGDVPALAEALAELAVAPDVARAWGAQGRARLEARFSVRRVVDEHLALYRELLEARGRAP